MKIIRWEMTDKRECACWSWMATPTDGVKLVKYALLEDDEDALLPRSAWIYPKYVIGRQPFHMTVCEMYGEDIDKGIGLECMSDHTLCQYG